MNLFENQIHMIKLIHSSNDAFNWAFNIGNHDQMIKLIDNEEIAYLWNLNIHKNADLLKKFPGIKNPLAVTTRGFNTAY